MPAPAPRTLFLAATALVLVAAACSAAPGASGPAGATAAASSAPVAPSATSTAAPAGRPSDLPLGTPRIPKVGPTAAPVTGEAPAAIVAGARTDLATRVGADAAASAEIVVSEAVTWPDGSLGCPVRGQLYPQVVTPGYHLVLRVGTTTYDYRATESGVVGLCEHGVPGG